MSFTCTAVAVPAGSNRDEVVVAIGKSRNQPDNLAAIVGFRAHLAVWQPSWMVRPRNCCASAASLRACPPAPWNLAYATVSLLRSLMQITAQYVFFGCSSGYSISA